MRKGVKDGVVEEREGGAGRKINISTSSVTSL